jgi:phosphomannomutase
MSLPTYSPLEERPLKDTICLFDVDGPLTPARLVSLLLPSLAPS